MNKKVAKIINDWDPINLFPSAPKDEYEVEIELISNLLKETNDVVELAEGIGKIFGERFGTDVFIRDVSECQDIAKKLLN